MDATTNSAKTVAFVLKAVDAIRPVIEAHRDEGERDRRQSDVVMEAMREAGLARLWVLREYDGDEVDIPTFMAAVERIASMDGATGWTFAISCGSAALTAFLSRTAALEVYTDGPDGFGAGTANPRGRAIPAEGGYRLTGQWPLVTAAHHASRIGLAAIVFDGDKPQVGRDGAPDIRHFMLNANDCEILDTWHSLGLRGTDSTDVSVTDLFVPDHRVFTPLASPPVVTGALYRCGLLPLLAFAHTSVAFGIARAAIAALVQLTVTKTPAMSQTLLASRPTIHASVARAEAQLQSAHAYLYEVAQEFMAAVEAGDSIPDDLEARRRLACVATAESCGAVVDSFRLAGATAIFAGHPLERCLRDIRTMAQHIFVSPTTWETAGQFYLGHGLGKF